MPKITKEQRLRNIVCRGLVHLQERLSYGQNNVVNKLKMLDKAVSTASLSNIKNNRSVGLFALNTAAKGMEILLQQELDMVFEVEKQDFVPNNTPGWTALVVPEKPPLTTSTPTFTLHADGRVSIPQKTSFIDSAQQEIIEVGIRLNSFSNYFVSQNQWFVKS